MGIADESAGSGLALGLIAGGRGTRLGGVDKALLRVDGVRQIDRLLARFGGSACEVLVARGPWPRPDGIHPDVRCVPDLLDAGAGPFAALHALAAECGADWLLTLPIDLHAWPEDLVPALWKAGCSADGSVLEDAGGLQPLVALWRVTVLRRAVADGLAAHELAVRGLVERAGLRRVQRLDCRLGNLNTLEDLVASGASRAQEP